MLEGALRTQALGLQFALVLDLSWAGGRQEGAVGGAVLDSRDDFLIGSAAGAVRVPLTDKTVIWAQAGAALVGAAAEMATAFSGARKNRLDLSVGIALGSSAQIALFVAPVLVLLSHVIGPAPMNLQFWPGAVIMMLIATMTVSLVTNSGRSAWFVGVLVLLVYLIFAMTLYLLPPQVP